VSGNTKNRKSKTGAGNADDALLGEALRKYKSVLLPVDEKADAEDIERLMQLTARLRKSHQKPGVVLFFSRPHSWLAMAAAIALLLGAFSVLRPGSGKPGLVIVDMLSQDDMRFAMRGDSEISDAALVLSNLQAVATQQIGKPVETVTADAVAGAGRERYKLVVSYADSPDDMVDLVLQEVATGKEIGRASIRVDSSPDDLQEALSILLRKVRTGRK